MINCRLGRCKMTYKKLAYLIAFVVIALAAMPVMAAVQINNAAPDFTVMDVNGDEFSLSALKGKKVVLEWTNHQCPFVVKHYESGNMQKTQKQAIEQDVVWVSIVSSAQGKQGYTSAEDAKNIMQEEGHHASTRILDPSGEIGRLYGAKTTPHMFIIDEQGNLVYQGAIDSDSSPRQSSIGGATNYVLAALDDLNAGKAVQKSVTRPYGCSVKY